MGSNKFKANGNSPPWEFPLNGEPFLNNISHPPMTQANAIDNHSRKVGAHRKKHMSGGEVAVLVGGVALIVTGAALFIGIRLKQSNENRSDSFEDSLGRNSSFQSYPPASIIGNISRNAYLLTVIYGQSLYLTPSCTKLNIRSLN